MAAINSTSAKVRFENWLSIGYAVQYRHVTLADYARQSRESDPMSMLALPVPAWIPQQFRRICPARWDNGVKITQDA